MILGLVAKGSVTMVCPGACGVSNGQEVRAAGLCQIEKGQRLDSLDTNTWLVMRAEDVT